MEKKNNKGRQVNYIWAVAGGYLVYLGAKLLYEAFQGAAGHVWIGIVAGIVFIGVGGWLVFREWQAYRYRDVSSEQDAEQNAELPADENAEIAETDEAEERDGEEA